MLSLSKTLSVLSLTASVLGVGITGPPSRPDSKIARNVLEGKSEGYCSPSGPIESTHCQYETVESLNTALFPQLHKLVYYPFFRHYKVDLYRECPFWYENGFCMNRDCGVEAADESEIPEKWRAKALSEVRTSASDDDGISSCYFREQDFCYIEDDASQDGQYIDLTINPERFTGYAGQSAHQVWRAIYEENCFGLSEAAMDVSRFSTSDASSGFGGLTSSGRSASGAGVGFSKLSEGWGTEMAKGVLKENDMCEEKKLYYRVISGLHASISIHICHEYLDQQTGEWNPNLQCFINRLAGHPERLSNVYFNAVLLLRAVARAAPYLEAYDIGTAPTTRRSDERSVALRAQDQEARNTLKEVLKLAGGEMSQGFDESEFFAGQDALLLKDQFKSHFRNVSRIMDCVGCDKCRLWGKLQVSGFGTALKILFELDEKALDPKVNPDLLQRSEVVALFNTLHRISESLAAVEDFRKMYAATQAEEVRASKKKIRQSHSAQHTQAQSTSEAFSLSTLLGFGMSAVEAFRRSCRGCFELCWKRFGRGVWRDIVEWLTGQVGGIIGKVEL